MAVEIERKFLLRNDAWRTQVVRVERMAQAYLNDVAALRDGRQNISMRVRISADSAWLNLKSRDAGMSRQEFEYAIPMDDAQALLTLCVGGRVEKLRHHVEHAGHRWEIDEFLGDNDGLVVAEIELSSEDEVFERPDWLGLEVTDQPRYFNLALAEQPYMHWSAKDKRACL